MLMRVLVLTTAALLLLAGSAFAVNPHEIDIQEEFALIMAQSTILTSEAIPVSTSVTADDLYYDVGGRDKN